MPCDSALHDERLTFVAKADEEESKLHSGVFTHRVRLGHENRNRI